MEKNNGGNYYDIEKNKKRVLEYFGDWFVSEFRFSKAIIYFTSQSFL